MELLFSGMDRLLALVTGTLTPPHHASRAVRPPAPGAHVASAAAGTR
jgi:hypothetical protein